MRPGCTRIRHAKAPPSPTSPTSSPSRPSSGRNGGTEDETIAALLHDAPEDRGGRERLQDIRERFGDEVAEIVDGCTNTYEDPKPAWRPRKEAYIAYVAGAPASVRLVSAADKLHNARSMLADLRSVGDELWDRFTGRKDGTLW